MSKEKSDIIPGEHDIFNYVFFPDKLSPEIKTAIEGNKHLKRTIDFYKELLADTLKPISKSLRKKIASAIPAYSFIDEIRLYPLPAVAMKNTGGRRLAAGSESRHFISEMSTRTFVDEDKEYMIKVIIHDSTTKVFVFSVKNDVVNNFDIIIEPAEARYHFKDNSQPLIINSEIEIDSIRLEFGRNGMSR